VESARGVKEMKQIFFGPSVKKKSFSFSISIDRIQLRKDSVSRLVPAALSVG